MPNRAEFERYEYDSKVMTPAEEAAQKEIVKDLMQPNPYNDMVNQLKAKVAAAEQRRVEEAIEPYKKRIEELLNIERLVRNERDQLRLQFDESIEMAEEVLGSHPECPEDAVRLLIERLHSTERALDAVRDGNKS